MQEKRKDNGRVGEIIPERRKMKFRKSTTDRTLEVFGVGRFVLRRQSGFWFNECSVTADWQMCCRMDLSFLPVQAGLGRA